MRFSERETCHFVKAYLKQENLWNNKHLAYKSNERRLVSYNAVLEEFKQTTGIELTLTQLRVKIKNLKSTYAQELEKIRRRSSIGYKPAMKWFAIWHKRVMTEKDNTACEDSNTTDDENQKSWLPPVTDDNSIDPFESSNLDNEYVMLVKSEPALKQNTIESNSYKRTRKTLEHAHSNSTEMSDIPMTDFLNSTNLVKDDEFDIYGKFIASQLRNMDIQRALTLQIEIQNLVSRARLADLTERNSE